MLNSQVVAELNDLFAEELGLATNANPKKRCKKWHCPIQIAQLGEYIVVPLTSIRKIKSEGYLMLNCVRQYVDLCQGGEYLLFSIRNLDDERVATLGVKNIGDRWYYDDCLGRENSPIIESILESFDADNNMIYEVEYTEIFSVAHEVVRLLNFQTMHSEEF